MSECGAVYVTNTLGGMDICTRQKDHTGGHDWGQRCFGKNCENRGTILDIESGPVQAMLCPKHYAEIMKRRDENEASFDRIFSK